MLAYSYQCECGCRFVQNRSIKEDVSVQECPECNKMAISIITGGATTIFVGTNWPGKQAKMDADADKIRRDGSDTLNNPDYWSEDE